MLPGRAPELIWSTWCEGDRRLNSCIARASSHDSSSTSAPKPPKSVAKRNSVGSLSIFKPLRGGKLVPMCWSEFRRSFERRWNRLLHGNGRRARWEDVVAPGPPPPSSLPYPPRARLGCPLNDTVLAVEKFGPTTKALTPLINPRLHFPSLLKTTKSHDAKVLHKRINSAIQSACWDISQRPALTSEISDSLRPRGGLAPLGGAKVLSTIHEMTVLRDDLLRISPAEPVPTSPPVAGGAGAAVPAASKGPSDLLPHTEERCKIRKCGRYRSLLARAARRQNDHHRRLQRRRLHRKCVSYALPSAGSARPSADHARRFWRSRVKMSSSCDLRRSSSDDRSDDQRYDRFYLNDKGLVKRYLADFDIITSSIRLLFSCREVGKSRVGLEKPSPQTFT